MTIPDYFEFNPRLKNMLEMGETLNSKGEKIKIRSHSTLGNIRVLRELILRERYSKTLEVGLAHGASALTILSTLREVGGDGFCHSAIDPFQDKDWGGAGMRVLLDEGFANQFSLHKKLSALALPALVEDSEEYDLIYVDGSHLFEDVFVDFYYSVLLLRTGGVVLFDDCCDYHVAKVIKFIKSNFREFLSEIDYGGLEDPEKSLKKKIGNLLGYRQIRGFRKISDPPRQWNASFSKF
jgi:predicted O-methyltransferase YrrM